MSKIILSIKNLNKVFEKKGHKVHALSNINLNVEKGEYISIQGPSGSGKTTLLNILGCLDKPTSGKLIIDGTKASELSEKKLSKIRANKLGFVFQDFNLIPILNAIENVLLPMELTKMPEDKKIDRAHELLDLVGLSKRIDHRPGELSAGEQQRVAIARALANKPAIILADEPTGNLDSKSGKHIMKLLDDLNRKMGTTIILVTHNDEMARLTKKIIYLKDGEISEMLSLREGNAFEISEALDLPPRIVNTIIRAGYKELENILDISDANLKTIKNLKRKDIPYIRNRIKKYKKMHKLL